MEAGERKRQHSLLSGGPFRVRLYFRELTGGTALVALLHGDCQRSRALCSFSTLILPTSDALQRLQEEQHAVPGHENGTLLGDQTAQAVSFSPGQAPRGFWAAPARL